MSGPPSRNWQSACVSLSCSFRVTYAIEFFCLSVAKLLVLDRMLTFSAAKEQGKAERLSNGRRMVMILVVTGNLVGLGSYIASAVFYKEAGDLAAAAAAGYAANITSTADDGSLASQPLAYADKAKARASIAQYSGSFQEFSEVTVLLIIIAAFAVTGVASARRIAASLRAMNREAHRVQGQLLRLQLVATVAVVFVTFLLRAVFSTMYAIASSGQDTAVECTGPCNPNCLTTGELMLRFLSATPEFQAMVVLIASPLSLLVALWGMTSMRMLRLMRQDRSENRLNTMDGK